MCAVEYQKLIIAKSANGGLSTSILAPYGMIYRYRLNSGNFITFERLAMFNRKPKTAFDADFKKLAEIINNLVNHVDTLLKESQEGDPYAHVKYDILSNLHSTCITARNRFNSMYPSFQSDEFLHRCAKFLVVTDIIISLLRTTPFIELLAKPRTLSGLLRIAADYLSEKITSPITSGISSLFKSKKNASHSAIKSISHAQTESCYLFSLLSKEIFSNLNQTESLELLKNERVLSRLPLASAVPTASTPPGLQVDTITSTETALTPLPECEPETLHPNVLIDNSQPSSSTDPVMQPSTSNDIPDQNDHETDPIASTLPGTQATPVIFEFKDNQLVMKIPHNDSHRVVNITPHLTFSEFGYLNEGIINVETNTTARMLFKLLGTQAMLYKLFGIEPTLENELRSAPTMQASSSSQG